MVLFCTSIPVLGQLTPGPLHRVHEGLEGLRNCTQCHAIGSKDFQNKCLECHDILKKQIEGKKGLHAQPGYGSCQLCHSEHHGKDFELIHWPDGMDGFNHELTGFPLLGAHQSQNCRDCHQSEHIQNPQPLRVAGKDLGRTFLGLSQDCSSCHQDPHEGQLDQDCLSCHTMDAWKPAAKFDHDSAAFQLEGAHLQAECSDCHLQAVTTPTQILRAFKPLDHASCTSCHEDLHRGTLSQDCLSCHSMTAWNPVPNFNHAQTAYPLTGKHRQVSCESCHTSIANLNPDQPKVFEGLAFASCADCHQDPHQKRLGSDCASCHQPVGWEKVNASNFDHARTRFPLEGKHVSVACESCHRPDRPLAIAEFDDCQDCHQDVHHGQFLASASGGNCESCHSLEGFRPALFSLARHTETQFPLEGAHLALPCLACHKPVGKPRFPEPTVHFNLGSSECRDCHANPHGPRLLEISEQKSCLSCHTVARWDALNFDHESTGFALVGGHTSVSCGSCHHQDSSQTFYLTTLNSDCASCHADAHLGQFKNASGITDCQKCHANASWEPQHFDHNRDSSFRLDGAHLRASCESCHPKATLGERVYTRFKPIGSQCEDCHTQNPRGGPK